MAGRLWKREYHLRRLVHSRHRDALPRPHRRGYGQHPDFWAAWPHRHWDQLGSFTAHWEAQRLASQHPGSVLERVYRPQGRCRSARLVGYRVGFATRLGAPFRTQVMTWALQETQCAYEDVQSRKWIKRGSLKGGVAQYTRGIRRRQRQVGKKACQLILKGEVDAAEDLDPQPQRWGVMWLM